IVRNIDVVVADEHDVVIACQMRLEPKPTLMERAAPPPCSGAAQHGGAIGQHRRHGFGGPVAGAVVDEQETELDALPGECPCEGSGRAPPIVHRKKDMDHVGGPAFDHSGGPNDRRPANSVSLPSRPPTTHSPTRASAGSQ